MNIRCHRIAAACLLVLAAGPLLAATGDAALAAQVQAVLDHAMGPAAAQLQVQVDHGTVTLSGWTELPRDEAQARALASRVPGVTQAYSRVRSWSSDDDR